MIDLQSEVGRLLVAMALGTAVGLERELSDKPAGLKTNALICLGSAVFTMLSVRVAGAGQDPGRIAAQIVSGIGFLGAGAIMREGEQVTGLTTAAMIWVVAAIGMGAGLGFHTLAALGTLCTLAVQIGMAPLDSVVEALRQRLVFRVVTPPEERAIEAVARILHAHHIRVVRRKVMKRDNLYHSEWFTNGKPGAMVAAARELLGSEQVIELNY